MDVLNLTKQEYEYVKVNSTKWLDLTDLPNEIWVYINGFEDCYMVSNYGRVKSLYNNIILKQGKNSNNYYIVVLCKNNKKYTKKVHRLVALSFLPKIIGKDKVNHKQPVTEEECINCLYNLEWCDMKENTRHSISLGRNSPPPRNTKRGIKHPQSHPVIQLDVNDNFIKQWGSLHEINRDTGYARCCISNVCNGKSEKAYGYKWKYGITESEVKNTDEDNNK